MTSGGIAMGMTPPHPGAFVRIEAIDACARRPDRRQAVSAGSCPFSGAFPHPCQERTGLDADGCGVDRGARERGMPQSCRDGGERHAGGHGSDAVTVAQAFWTGLRPADRGSGHQPGDFAVGGGPGERPQAPGSVTAAWCAQLMHELQSVHRTALSGMAGVTVDGSVPGREKPLYGPL